MTRRMWKSFVQKNPRTHKNQIGTSPPPKTQNSPPPKTRNFMDMGFPAERTQFFHVPIKLAQPFPAPELRTKILWTLKGFFWFVQKKFALIFWPLLVLQKCVCVYVCVVPPVFAKVAGELWAADPNTCPSIHEANAKWHNLRLLNEAGGATRQQHRGPENQDSQHKLDQPIGGSFSVSRHSTKKAHKHKRFGPVALGTTPGLSWDDPGLSQGQTQVVPGTNRGFLLILHSGSRVCPWDKPGLSLGQIGGEWRQKKFRCQMFMCLSYPYSRHSTCIIHSYEIGGTQSTIGPSMITQMFIREFIAQLHRTSVT